MFKIPDLKRQMQRVYAYIYIYRIWMCYTMPQTQKMNCIIPKVQNRNLCVDALTSDITYKISNSIGRSTHK